jgi:hypothetical protein
MPLLALSAGAGTYPARLESVDTCFVAPPDDIAAETGSYQCGYIVVPENPDRTDSPEIRLGYLRMPARAADPRAPFFMLAGGPGSTFIKPLRCTCSTRRFSDRSSTSGMSSFSISGGRLTPYPIKALCRIGTRQKICLLPISICMYVRCLNFSKIFPQYLCHVASAACWLKCSEFRQPSVGLNYVFK